jgi:hypothetical protein
MTGSFAFRAQYVLSLHMSATAPALMTVLRVPDNKNGPHYTRNKRGPLTQPTLRSNGAFRFNTARCRTVGCDSHKGRALKMILFPRRMAFESFATG